MDDKPAGLAIVNVTNPESPELTGFVETDGSAEDVFIGETNVFTGETNESGAFAHVADGYEGLVIIDVTDPVLPGKPRYIRTPGYASGIYIRENVGYMACGTEGLVIVKQLPITVIPTNGYAEDVFVSRGYAYVANSGAGIAIVDLSDYSLEPPIDTPGYAFGVFVDRATTFDNRNYAYVADYDGGLAIVDVEYPSNPGEPIWTPTAGPAEGVFVSRSKYDGRNYAYVANHDNGLAIVDVEEPTNPDKPVYQFVEITGVAFGVFVSGNYAYLACDDGGLAIVDVTNPTDPQLAVDNFPTPGSAMGIFVSEEGPEPEKLYAYVACGWELDGNGRLAIFDVTTPTEPIPAGEVPIPGGYAFGVHISENIAYVAYSNEDYSGGLAVIDVTTLEYIADVPTGNAFGVYVKGDYAYVANHDRGLAVVNISSTTYPIEGQIDTSGWAYGVFAEATTGGNLVYVADQYSLTVIKHVTCVPPPGDVSGNCIVSAYDASLILQHVVGLVTLGDEQKIRADVSGNGTISAYDAALVLQYTVGLIIEFPAAPTLKSKDEQKLLASAISDLERVPLSQEQRRVLEQLKHLYQALPTRTSLFQNYPNPFNPETWIPYQLDKDSNVTIRIMDVQGRLVRQINLGNKLAGVYSSRERAAYWDGRNTLGEKVSSGVYFYILQVEGTGKFTATKKMVIMK
jgi:hypothetical protein